MIALETSWKVTIRLCQPGSRVRCLVRVRVRGVGWLGVTGRVYGD